MTEHFRPELFDDSVLAFLQSGSVPELDMHESKHFLPGQFVHSDQANREYVSSNIKVIHSKRMLLILNLKIK